MAAKIIHQDTTLTIRIPRDLAEAIRQAARDAGESQSVIIRQALRVSLSQPMKKK